MIRCLRLSALALAVAAPLPGPATAQVGQAPGFAFEIRLKKDAYGEAVAALDPNRVDPAKVAASKFPAYSARVDTVTPGGQADRAGLKGGWRIVALNGREIWSQYQRLPMEDGNREIVAISPEGEKRIFHFEDGLIGTQCINAHYPEIAVLDLIPRGKWDHDILVATVAWYQGDHELAETALRLAVNRGMPPNPVLTHFGSLVALNRGDYGLARSLNAAFVKKYPDDVPRFFRAGMRTLGACLGDFELLKSAVMENDGLGRPMLQPATVDVWRKWKDASPRAPLLPLAKAASGPDLLSKCESVVARWQSPGHVMDFNPARDGTYVKELQPKRYHRLSFAPPGGIHDVIWTIRFGFREIAPPDPYSHLTICLVDRQEKTAIAQAARFLPVDKSVVCFRIWRTNGPQNLVHLSAGPCGAHIDCFCELQAMTTDEFASFKQLAETHSPESKAVKRHVHEVSLIRIGREVGIVLNGRELLHAPIDPKAEDLFCILENEGLSVVVDGMTLHEIGRD